MIEQRSLFDVEYTSSDVERILLYALGEFQSRGKVLAGRELALDRLRGAFKRAAETFGAGEFTDEALAEGLQKLDAKIVRVPNFVAKHPFRVTVHETLADRAVEFFKTETEKNLKQ